MTAPTPTPATLDAAVAHAAARAIAHITRVSAREHPTHSFGPGIPLTASIGGNLLVMAVTPRGYQQLTGRRAPRVSRMHAAYRARKH